MTSQQSNGYIPGYSGVGLQAAQFPGPFASKFAAFSFRKRIEKLDWKKLASVDVDMVARNMDFATLQDNVTNITFCNIESELQDSRSVDPNCIKLFKLAQLIIEYLLEYLFNKMQELRTELEKEKIEHGKTHVDVVEKLRAELADVKTDLRQRKKIIATQQQILQGGGSDSYNRCAYCAKAFLNASFLHAHLTRRHPEMVNVGYGQQQRSEPEPVPAPAPVVVKSGPDPELMRELDELRRRLESTESQLVDERNRRNDKQQADSRDKQWMESKFHTEMEEWKREQLEMHQRELEKVRSLFSKELKDVNEKLVHSESALEELRQSRAQGSTLGALRDDIDPDEVQRHQARIDQLNSQVESEMERKLIQKDKAWQKKFDAAALQHKRELNEMIEARLREVEKKFSDEAARSAADEDLKRREALLAMKNAMQKAPPRVQPRPVEEPQFEAEAAPVIVPPAARPPPLVDELYTDDEEEEEEEEEKEEEEGEMYEEEVDAKESDDEVPEHEEGLTLTMSGPDRLKAELKRNPDFLLPFRNDVEEELLIELEKLGISRRTVGIEENWKNRINGALQTNRSQNADEFPRFYDIRNHCVTDVEKMARKQLRQQQRPKSASPRVMRSQKGSRRADATPPIASKFRQEDLSQTAPLPSKQSSRQQNAQQPASQKQKTPKVQIMTTPQQQSQKRSPQPVQRTPDLDRPKPSPRARVVAAGEAERQKAAKLPSAVALSTEGNTARSEQTDSQWDSDDPWTDRQDDATGNSRQVPEPRPRARTPTRDFSLQSSKPQPGPRPPAASQMSTEGNFDDDDDEGGNDWDELSDLNVLDPTANYSSSKPPGGSVQDKAKNIEQQLAVRTGKKMPGAVDTVGGKAGPSRPVVTQDDDDDDSLASVSSMGDADHATKPEVRVRQSVPVRGSIGASITAPTLSTNTYGSSQWGSGKGATASTVNTKEDEYDDEWDISDRD